MPSVTSRDIDRILDAIRAEARARGSKAAVGRYSLDAAATESAPVAVAMPGLPPLELHHARDFLSLPLDTFLGEAYRKLIGREPDASGATHYQRQLLAGRLTRIEVLGRLALSPEGRRRRGTVRGVVLAALVATFYRLPIAGPLLAVLARLLRLPAHYQDRSTIEATALATGTWMKR